MPADSLPAYRVKARNTALQSENAIHHDDVAQRYGFRGGLVPGVTVYAYLTEPLVAAFGPGWLARGTATVRFHKPVIEGEELEVTGAVTSRGAGGVSVTVTGSTAATPEAAVLTATLPAGSPTPVNLSVYGTAALPDPRPEATRTHLASVDVLGTPENTYDEGCAAEWLDKVSDPLPLYRGGDGWVHPAFFLDQANRALRQNVRLGPWIHAGSAVRHLGGARVGETLATRGRVRSVFEKKGREFVELDLVIVAGQRPRPVAHVLHTAIYRL
ncbi:MAG TPA: MaoC family dehydratase [Methylomirabilota bacterium]|nr:MaoC family dehydratase [Methylomirabilota bacterium]